MKEKKLDKFWGRTWGLKNPKNINASVIFIVIGQLETITEFLEKKTGGIGNQRKNRDFDNYSTIEFGKSSGDLRRHPACPIEWKTTS